LWVTFRGIHMPADSTEKRIEDAVETQAARALEMILSASNADDEMTRWSIKAYRVLGPNREGMREPWLRNVSLEELEDIESVLREEFGPGRYRLRVRRDRRPFTTFDVEISATVNRDAPAPARHTEAPRSEVAEILLAMQAQQREFLTGLATLMKPTDTRSATDHIKEFAGIVAAVKELMPPPPSASIADTFKMAWDMAKETIGAGGESNWTDIVREAINSPAAKELVQAFAAARQPPQQPRMVPQPQPRSFPPPRAAPAGPPPPQPQSAPPTGAAQLPPELQRALDFLVQKAQEGAQPELWAEWALDQLPDPVLEMLDRLANPVDDLAGLHPGIAANRPWFTQLIEGMLQVAESDREAASEPDPLNPNSAFRNDPTAGRPFGNAGGAETHAQASVARQAEPGAS
jgi:hypothetical protein